MRIFKGSQRETIKCESLRQKSSDWIGVWFEAHKSWAEKSPKHANGPRDFGGHVVLM